MTTELKQQAHRTYRQSFIEIISRFLRTHGMRKRDQQAGPRGPELGHGAPQPVARLLDESEELDPYADIAVEYAKSFGHSPFQDLCSATGGSKGRKGSGKENQVVKLSAPESILSALHLVVDTECCCVLDRNQYGEQKCGREAVGICSYCGDPICGDCREYEPCPMAPNGKTWHRVIAQ